MARRIKTEHPNENWRSLGTKGSWQVSKHLVTGDVYIEHKCEKDILMLVSGDGICFGCFKEAPKEIIALFKLAKM